MLITATAQFEWLLTGDAAFGVMLAAIAAAKRSVRLQMYIFADEGIGLVMRQACLDARKRGVQVWILVDAAGSLELSDSFWNPLREAGAHVRWFNPLQLDRFAIRNHRKILVCDDAVAVIGGFNVAPEYEGDGVAHGWCDHGLKLTGELAEELAEAFDAAYIAGEFKQKRFMRMRRSTSKRLVPTPEADLLLGGPGRGYNPIKQKIAEDLKNAQSVQIVMAYFLPPWTILHRLIQRARGGARVQIILAGKSDVTLSQLASRSLYSRLLRAGIEIYEYQPQILHAKLVIIDGIAYVGSANLDTRSLNINYELMVRVKTPELAAGAKALFEADLKHAVRIERKAWRKQRGFWAKLKERWAHFLLAKVDPNIALKQFRALRD